jgi:hypothetical protein
MKMLTNYANFPERDWCSQAHFFGFLRIQKLACSVIKKFPEAVCALFYRFLKDSFTVDSFSQITDCKSGFLSNQ